MMASRRTTGDAEREAPAAAAQAPEHTEEVPETFPNVDAERAFWDQHDTGLLAGFGAVEDRGSPAAGLAHVLSVRLDQETFRALAAAARRVGVGPSTLLRVWARKWLRAEVPQERSDQ